MATKYAQGAINWSGTWYDAPTGGSTTTKPVAGDTADLNAQNVTLDEDPVCDLIRTGATNAGGTLVLRAGANAITAAVSSSYATGSLVTWGSGTSLTITGDVTYSSTSTSGMLTVTTDQTLTINGTLTVSAAGYGVVLAGSGVLVISKAGGTAIASTSTGRGVSGASTGASTITGDISATAAGYGVLLSGTGTGGTLAITGDLSLTTNASTPLFCGSAGYTVTLSGTLKQTGAAGTVLNVSNGTVNWTGTRAIAASQYCYVQQTGGTINLGTSGTALTLNNSGVLVVKTTAGSLVSTYATINNAVDTAQVAVLGAVVAVHPTDAEMVTEVWSYANRTLTA